MADQKTEMAEDFAVKIIALHRELTSGQHEYVLSNQIVRSGTSIGANIAEAQWAESRPDFAHKLRIAQKECNETLYWLRLLKRTDYISELKFQELYNDCFALNRVLASIIAKVN